VFFEWKCFWELPGCGFGGAAEGGIGGFWSSSAPIFSTFQQ